jgi:hypothetical protein
LLLQNRVSDNVSGVKQFVSTRQHALGEERHFALVDGVGFATLGSRVIVSGIRPRRCASQLRLPQLWAKLATSLGQHMQQHFLFP